MELVPAFFLMAHVCNFCAPARPSKRPETLLGNLSAPDDILPDELSLFPPGVRIESEVRQIDFLPTLIEAFGLETTTDGFDGASFYSDLADPRGPIRPVDLGARKLKDLGYL